MSTPVRAFRCVAKGERWWTKGKVYPVVNGEIEDDDAVAPDMSQVSYTWAEEDMYSFSSKFIEVWLLPDGTEVEVLE